MKTGKILVIAAVLAVLGLIVGLFLLQPTAGSEGDDEVVVSVEPASFPPLPAPNAYEMFLQAADNTKTMESEVSEMSRAALENYLLSHDDAFEIARAAFQAECRVVLDGESEFSPAHGNGLKSLQRLGDVFTAKALLAEGKVQMQEALDAHLERMRLGIMIARGGMPDDILTGIVIEEAARSGIESLIRRLTKVSLEAALASLNELENGRATPDAHRKWGELLEATIHAGLVEDMTTKQREKRHEERQLAIDKNAEQLRKLRVLILQVAGRLFEFQNGTTPNTLSALLPKLIPEIPIDPISGEAFDDSVLNQKEDGI